MIPFLRDHKEKYTIGKKRRRFRGKSEAHKNAVKEVNWNRVGFPISTHNEKIHFKNKIKFEDL